MAKKARANLFQSMALSVAVFASSCGSLTYTQKIKWEPLVTCTKPIEINGQLDYPCGKCMACRIQRTQEWGTRLMHENQYHEHSIFLTLTYDEKHIPENGSLRKKELQDFIKRVRSDLHPLKIKHYSVGEYGEQTERSHYHLIIFGLQDNEETKKLIQQNWPKGLIHIGTVTIDSARYVAGYIQKKLYGKLAQQTYTVRGREPPFMLCSQGLGKAWAVENRTYLMNNQGLTINGVQHGVPRYYVKILDLDLTAGSEKQKKKGDENLKTHLENHNITVENQFDAILLSKKQKSLNLAAKSGQKTKKI